MDFLNGKIKTLYFRFLIAAFGSALITSIYSIVDMAMVGQYHGPAGTAALAVVAPIWNIIYSLGLLMGIGGSVLYSILRGKQGQEKQSNEYFTVSMIGAGVLALIVWGLVVFFDREMLMLFGADESTLALAREYVLPIKAVVPCFLLTQTLAAYLRNDGNPGLAPFIIRSYSLSFLLLPLNIFSTYYFQAVMEPKTALVVSLSRGLLVSGCLILLLPLIAGADAIWFAMPLTELLVAVYVLRMIVRYTKQISQERVVVSE